MTTDQPQHRRVAGRVRRGMGWCIAGIGLAAGVVGVGATPRVDAAPTNAGSVTIIDNLGSTLTSGGSTTKFGLKPPTGAACTGDTATGGYKVSSYMVPASVDPSTLTFDNGGPIPNATGNPTPSAFRQPLYANSSPFTNKNTSIDNGTGGVLINLPLFDLTPFASGDIPAGAYNIGYVCIKGTAGPTQLDKYWNTQITVAANAQDPIGIAWTAGAVTPPTTTTTAATTTTVSGSTTSTTVAESSTTAMATSTSDTVAASSSSVLDTSASSSSESSTTAYVGSGGGGGIVSTGIDATKWVVWALIALVLGRIVVLAARRIRVLPPDQR